MNYLDLYNKNGYFILENIYSLSEIKMMKDIIKNLDLKIPQQLSVIAFDDTELAELATPSYTVLSRDIDEIGRALGELVVQALEDKSSQVNDNTKRCRNIILGAELLVRESCSRPPSH